MTLSSKIFTTAFASALAFSPATRALAHYVNARTPESHGTWLGETAGLGMMVLAISRGCLLLAAANPVLIAWLYRRFRFENVPPRTNPNSRPDK